MPFAVLGLAGPPLPILCILLPARWADPAVASVALVLCPLILLNNSVCDLSGNTDALNLWIPEVVD